MSTILNALKKAKTEREKSVGPGRPASGNSARPSTLPGSTRPINARSEAMVAAGSSAAPTLSPSRPRYSTYQPAQAPSSRFSALAVLVVLVLAGVLGGATFLLTRNSANPPPGNGDSPQTASLAGSPGIAGFIDYPADDLKASESTGSTEPAEAAAAGLSLSADPIQEDVEGNGGPGDAAVAEPADLPGDNEIAMGGKTLVQIEPQPAPPPPDNGPGSPPPPPPNIDPRFIQSYIDYLNEPVDRRMRRSASRQADLPPEEEADDDSSRRRRRERDDDMTSLSDVHTTGPIPTLTPHPTPEPTPTIPPSPTVYPAGSKVMDSDVGWEVEGILWSDTSPSAIVNDTVVREGDTVNQVKILKINRDDITVEYQGNEIAVRF